MQLKRGLVRHADERDGRGEDTGDGGEGSDRGEAGENGDPGGGRDAAVRKGAINVRIAQN